MQFFHLKNSIDFDCLKSFCYLSKKNTSNFLFLSVLWVFDKSNMHTNW